MEKQIQKGRYRHYKGGFYEVLGLTTHSETGEELVLYQAEKDNRLWVRPTEMFFENVTVNGEKVSRFRKI